jgi:hypothetical protein
MLSAGVQRQHLIFSVTFPQLAEMLYFIYKAFSPLGKGELVSSGLFFHHTCSRNVILIRAQQPAQQLYIL